MNYYPFHIGDYVSATRHLSWEEDAAFRRLLDTYYTTERPIPLDHRQACRLVMAQTESQRQAVHTVLEEFFERTPEGWINKRADAEIEAMREKQQKQRDKANKRWGSAKSGSAALPRHEEADAVASKGDANAMPPTPTPTPTPIEEPSDADASGGKPPLLAPSPSPCSPPPADPRDVVFALGVPLLTASGVKESLARSFLGMQVKAHGCAKTAEALQRCAQERAVEPVSWLQKALGPIKTGAKAGKHAGFDQLDYRNGVTADGHLA